MTTAPSAAGASSENPLAIVCGSGTLPFAVTDAVTARGRSVFLYGLRGWADAQKLERYPHLWGSVGQFGRFASFARQHGCREVVMIGGLIRPSLWQFRIDLLALRSIPRLIAAYQGGDNHLLTGVARIFEHEGFRLVGAHEVAPEILVPEGVLGSIAPVERDYADITKGLEYLHASGKFDSGQAVVVAANQVLAVEAAEGTDQMLARVTELRINGRIRIPRGSGVLIKAPKPNQDRRFDLPSIGPRTIEGIARAGLAGLAVVAGATIIAEPEQVVEAADREKLFVIGVGGGTG